MRLPIPVFVIFAVLGLAACATPSDEPTAEPSTVTSKSAAAGQPTESPGPAETPGDTATPLEAAPATKATPKADDLTGFAATSEAWDRHHAAAKGKQFANGAVYNLEKSLDKAVGPYVYTGVTRTDKGRVSSYYRSFVPGTSLEAAKKLILQELPADTKVLWEREFDTCVQIEYRSKTLSRLAKSDDGLTNGVSVALVNIGDDGDLTGSLGSINSSVVGIGFTDKASDAPPC
jgi:hypothetical protein